MKKVLSSIPVIGTAIVAKMNANEKRKQAKERQQKMAANRSYHNHGSEFDCPARLYQ